MRVAVLSDIHANLPALDAVLADLPPVDGVWHLGDVVGYGPHPDEVVDRLRELGATGVLGNHDQAALGGSVVEAFNVDARNAMLWTRATISAATTAWLGELPTTRAAEGWTLVHGSPRDPIWEYVTGPAAARAALDALPGAGGLHGHTHVPAAWRPTGETATLELPADGAVVATAGARAFLNPGSVGQPRDGNPAAAWLLLDTSTGIATFRRTPYDVAATQRAMEAAGLPRRLVTRLESGR